MIELKQEKLPANYVNTCFQWPYGPAFAVNPRGTLIHRTRSIRTHREKNGKPRHNSTTYWCGNGTCADIDDDNVFTDKPPKDRLLCERCEALAVAHGETPASKLAGHHVHVGRLVARQTCCQEKRN